MASLSPYILTLITFIPLVAAIVVLIIPVKNERAIKNWCGGLRKWLERIAEQLKKEVVADEEAFTKGAFVNVGGWKGVDKELGGQLRQVLDNIGDEIWNDVAA